MATLKRWRRAQKYERQYWEQVAQRIAGGAERQLDWYAWKAAELDRRVAPFMDSKAKQSARVLEIGSGPIGIVTFLEWGSCVAIDPLQDFYGKNSVLTSLRRPAVEYVQGMGETLPFESREFSVVIVDNVIDHTHGPGQILDQVHRILADDGFLYLMVNIHTPLGAVLHRIAAATYVDRGHPYTFTQRGIRAFLARHRFTILAEETEDYLAARAADRASPRRIDRLKGYSGLSEYRYHAVCRRAES